MVGLEFRDLNVKAESFKVVKVIAVCIRVSTFLPGMGGVSHFPSRICQLGGVLRFIHAPRLARKQHGLIQIAT